ncbi:DUF4349 domain-containing protein [Cohnella laeviribosi]|uniref:DUF4349 domain-containing protein n=1 Tax=Cohnella laeviribosi TaxID=380174 RepID=UPI0003809948|nr:DUF4349 domain-containing protein [Cohnella laeviribosi]
MEKGRRTRIGSIGVWAAGSLLALALLLGGCSSGGEEKNDAAAGGMSAPGAPAAAEAQPTFEGGAQHDALPAAGQEAQAADVGKAQAQEAAGEAGSGSEADSIPPAAGAGIGPVADANAGYNRKMIYSANVTMKVASFAKAEEQVSNAIFQSGGYIVQFADTRTDGRIGSTYVIKVPSSGFSSFLAELKQIPHLEFERQMQGNDVTEEYVDLEARLKAQQALEARLLAFMDKATKSDDLVRFSNEIASVQQKIEQIKGRMRYLDQNVAYSTVNLRLYEGEPEDMTEPAEDGNADLGARLARAMKGSARVLGLIGEGLLTFLAALLPVLLVAAILAAPTFVLVRRSRAARRERSAEKRRLLNAEKTPQDATASDEAAQDDAEQGESGK